jgi:hypothetical protein
MRKLIAALAISALSVLGAVTMSAAPQAHAAPGGTHCFASSGGGAGCGFASNAPFTPDQANDFKAIVRSNGGKASGSPVGLGQGAFPGPQPKTKP